MQNFEQAGQAVVKQVKELRYLESLNNILYCDRWQDSPVASFDYHSELGDYLMGLTHQVLLGEQSKVVLAQAQTSRLATTGSEIQQGALRYLQEQVAKMTKVPASLLQANERLNAEGQQIWEKAYHNNDLASILPVWEKQFALKRQLAAEIDPTQPPFQVLVQEFDQEYTLADFDRLFEQLKAELPALLEQAEPARMTENAELLATEVDEQIMRELGEIALELIGFSREKSTLYEMQHPVCVCVGPKDSRPSTGYRELFWSIQALLHEAGHGMYNYNSSDEIIAAGLWGGIEGAMHESQSIFYEKMVGGSFEFWQAFYPHLQTAVPKYRSIPLADFYAALSDIKLTPDRMQADELSYILHIIIRYEIEKGYFAGDYDLDELPARWEEKYQAYLGVTPANQQAGILQDVHWASGSIGYFQSYVLGACYAAQFKHQLVIDQPTAYQELAQGNCHVINQWLKENVHAYGQLYTPRELLKKVTGEDLNPIYLIQHLKERFS